MVELNLSCNHLKGTAASLSIHLSPMKNLEKLTIHGCSLTGKDMTYIADEALSHLPNLVELDISYNNLGGIAGFWSFHLNQMKHIEKLDLAHCSLTGEDKTYITEALSHLPNLVKLIA